MKILLIASHRPQKLIEPLKQINADFRTISFETQYPLIINLIRLSVTIIKQSKTYNPDILLCHDVRYIGLTTLLSAKLVSKACIIKIGGDITEVYRIRKEYYKEQRQVIKLITVWLTYRMELFILRHSDGILTVSHLSKESLLSQVDGKLPGIEVVSVPCDIAKFNVSQINTMDYKEFMGKNIILSVTNFNFREKIEGRTSG